MIHQQGFIYFCRHEQKILGQVSFMKDETATSKIYQGIDFFCDTQSIVNVSTITHMR